MISAGGGSFFWPPPKENYVYEGLQGAIAQAVILHNLGYDVWNWEDAALLRAYNWLREQCNFLPTGDDTWQYPLVDYFYNTSCWDGSTTSPGKNVGWTCWTHSGEGGYVAAHPAQKSSLAIGKNILGHHATYTVYNVQGQRISRQMTNCLSAAISIIAVANRGYRAVRIDTRMRK